MSREREGLDPLHDTRGKNVLSMSKGRSPMGERGRIAREKGSAESGLGVLLLEESDVEGGGGRKELGRQSTRRILMGSCSSERKYGKSGENIRKKHAVEGSQGPREDSSDTEGRLT